VLLKPNAIGRHLKDIFKQRNPPADQNNRDQRKIFTPLHLFKFEMPIPREGHEGVGQREKDYGANSFQCFYPFNYQNPNTNDQTARSVMVCYSKLVLTNHLSKQTVETAFDHWILLFDHL
jgi:hypothetical protein